MEFKFTLITTVILMGTVAADSAGYVLPSTGSASTTQFYLGPELSSGTACGVDALPNGQSTSGKQGGGPGYLYAAINQLAFGANPSVSGAGGPGGACGVCYWLTPVSAEGVALSANALIFKIIDECPASVALSGGKHCDQCTTSEVNDMGQHWHFDIAIDAMSTAQYNQFFNGVTDGSNWYEVYFEQTSCGTNNPTPPVKSWGCISGCSNNEAATVCEDTGFSKL
ncbi:glycoside hydrolase family 45 protein [Oidiodendron maius Zn]|uniref:Glycoside hydrolase family 45 protein n=1 Tax=Oidiodendron maius (strain Zn) TaxID=913774 RepID=A0A0C3HEK5_OIDMZ|nr:glycoside hydrolase family 45 protein [Oidiodendron maius Zn]